MPPFTDQQTTADGLPGARSAQAPAGPQEAAFRDFLDRFRTHLDRELIRWLETRREEAAQTAAEWADLVAELERLVAGGGKRLRPALVEIAYRASGGRADEAALRLGMAVELLHTYLLVHDDIMDHSPVRRGAPTTHVVFEERHRERSWPGDPSDYGRSVAILVGDLAHSLSVELSRPHPDAEGDPVRVARCFDTMCSEVIGGQFLEMTLPLRTLRERPDRPDRPGGPGEPGGPEPSASPDSPSEDELLRALRLKSGRYSVERPLELGALLAGAGPEVLDALQRYGQAVGDAFQLQDDVLGTFGEASAVGKPTASDLEEGKYTFLVHHALAGAGPDDRAWLRGTLGRGELSAAEVERAREILRSSGALDAVQAMVDERLDGARTALDGLGLPANHRERLLGLVDYLSRRDR